MPRPQSRLHRRTRGRAARLALSVLALSGCAARIIPATVAAPAATGEISATVLLIGDAGAPKA